MDERRAERSRLLLLCLGLFLLLLLLIGGIVDVAVSFLGSRNIEQIALIGSEGQVALEAVWEIGLQREGEGQLDSRGSAPREVSSRSR